MALQHGRAVSFVAHDGSVLQPPLIAEQRGDHWVRSSVAHQLSTSTYRSYSVRLAHVVRSYLPTPSVEATYALVPAERTSISGAAAASGHASRSRPSPTALVSAFRVSVTVMPAGHAFSPQAARLQEGPGDRSPSPTRRPIQLLALSSWQLHRPACHHREDCQRAWPVARLA